VPVESTNLFGMKLILIPPGEFMMGSTPEQVEGGVEDVWGSSGVHSSAAPQHRVTITRPFLMGSTEVTVGQFKRFVESTNFITLAERWGSGNSTSTEPETDPKKKMIELARTWLSRDRKLSCKQLTWDDGAAFCNWRRPTRETGSVLSAEQNDQNGWGPDSRK